MQILTQPFQSWRVNPESHQRSDSTPKPWWMDWRRSISTLFEKRKSRLTSRVLNPKSISGRVWPVPKSNLRPWRARGAVGAPSSLQTVKAPPDGLLNKDGELFFSWVMFWTAVIESISRIFGRKYGWFFRLATIWDSDLLNFAWKRGRRRKRINLYRGFLEKS